MLGRSHRLKTEHFSALRRGSRTRSRASSLTPLTRPRYAPRVLALRLRVRPLLGIAVVLTCALPSRVDAQLGTKQAQHAAHALRLALIGLPDEVWGRDFKQIRLPERAPLQTFPRLTAAAFAASHEDDARRRHWYVPVVFDVTEETFARGDADTSDPADWLSYWLERTGDKTWKPATGRFTPIDASHVIRFRDLEAAGVVDPLLHDKMKGRAALVLRIPADQPDSVAAGFYWLRMAPRWPSSADDHRDAGAKDLLDGDLPEMQGRLARYDARAASDPAGAGKEILASREAIAAVHAKLECKHAIFRLGLNECSYPLKHFWPEMREATKHLGKDTIDDPARFTAALSKIYERDTSPAGVLLDDPSDEKSLPAPFSFVIGGDVQQSHDTNGFRRFLHVVEGRPTSPGARISADRLAAVLGGRKVKFVLFAGDLADNGASSDIGRLAFNVFGLYPPMANYQEENRALAGEIRQFSMPFVAVPGNHDGMVGYQGILNWLLSAFGSRRLDWVNDVVPVLVRPPLPPFLRSVPRYDGLGEWRYTFGPTSFGFQYRGQTFLGLNSFHLTARERSGNGSVIFNWGGGVTSADVEWFGDALDGLPGDGRPDVGLRRTVGHQFVFMHHDPRAATPNDASRDIDHYGIYDEIDNPMSFLTLGHFGLGHSPQWDIFVPVVTPASHHVSRLIDDWLNSRGRQQEEWMRRSLTFPGQDPSGAEGYGARLLIDAMNDRLSPSERGGGISHVFFAHDDVPLGPHDWVQRTGDDHDYGRVFPERRHGEWQEGREMHFATDRPPIPGLKLLLAQLFKLKNDEPPDWAKAMRPEQGNAHVYRLDDIAYPGAAHGFHVVTIVPLAPGESRVDVEWIPLPD